MKETDFNRKFIDELQKKYPHMHGWKIHGHDMQVAGIPDNVYCINGKFVAIEFKIQRDGKIPVTKSLKRQLRELKLIKNAHGIGLIVAFDENRHKILIHNRRIDYHKINSSRLKIDWDFEFSKYENAIDIVKLMIER